MTTNNPFYNIFRSGIENIRNQSKDPFHNKLYYSNVISLMEQYLSGLFINEITKNRKYLIKLSSHGKFNADNLPLVKVINLSMNDIDNILIDKMKNLVWHRLNDIEGYFKHVFNIKFNISRELLSLLETRHDLIHRNGFNMDGQETQITEDKLVNCIRVVEDFINDIDKKYNSFLNSH